MENGDVVALEDRNGRQQPDHEPEVAVTGRRADGFNIACGYGGCRIVRSRGSRGSWVVLLHARPQNKSATKVSYRAKAHKLFSVDIHQLRPHSCSVAGYK